jgi:hypothetical protein
MPNNHRDVNSLAQDFFDEIVSGKDIAKDAFDRFLEVAANAPEVAWDVVRRLVAIGTTESDLSIIGAGPIEELLIRHPAHYVDEVIREGMRNAKFRRALRYTNIGGAPELILDQLKRFQNTVE